MEQIPNFADKDFKELVVQVWNVSKNRSLCNFLEGDFETIKRARSGVHNTYRLRFMILGLPFDQLPLYINKFTNKNNKEELISYQIVRWRLQIGK